MQPKQFKYLYRTFTPVRRFSEREQAEGIRLPLRSTGIGRYAWCQPNTWDHEKFYEKARKAGSGNYDVFLYHGKEVVPGENELFFLD
jgi:hypothetical protein